MLESDVGAGTTETSKELSYPEKKILLQTYLDATSGILDFGIKRVDMFNCLEDMYFPDKPIGLASIILFLAVGAQCQGMRPFDLRYASNLFDKGQALSFQGMLRDPSVEMVRNFLLMAFYMLGACHRNAAFMYLGVAAKAASALGLHRSEQYRDLSPDESQMRLSTWKSLRVLDTIVNSILGRSGGLSSIQQDSRLSTEPNSYAHCETARELALQALFDLCPFVDELERKDYHQDTASSEIFLQRLQYWSKNLPPEIRASTDNKTLLSVSDELYVGGTHVACLYYFVVILTTRRFFTLYLLEQVHEHTYPNGSSRTSKADDKTSNLAYVCLNAAVSLAAAGHNAMLSRRMLNNMCLLKAWMFAAGLLLGFAMFAQGSSSGKETEEAFHQVRTVLKKLSELSLQAGHYYEILTSFSDAIELHQHKLSQERKAKASQYMDQIFTMGSDRQPDDAAVASSNAHAIGITFNGVENMNPANDIVSSDLSAFDIASGPDGTMISEGFPWPADDFAFGFGTYAPFFDEVV